ncbi:cytochrome P450 [Moorena producens PAL-8-15-08-1]|uniref:Cytochrome P450 n=1 Tax=Moorena producens PAL-8-15-08-1 TaxID=1458985 RepID=A0A1D8TSK9_9CYAN|nr:cytochrome P450 [Moorena producens]AOX00584.1 cytochrome P450 [Moorena producens PAL-8-15-08-1]
MFEHSWTILAFLVGTGISLLLWRWQQRQLALSSIYALPSPKGKWLTGNAMELLAAAKQGTYSLTIFRWMQQYGSMISLRIFTRPMVMVAKPQLIESILTEGQAQGIFTRSPSFYHAYKDVFGVHIGNQVGEAWKWRRQTAAPAFRASRFTQKFDLIRQGCQQVITQLQSSAQTGKEVQVDPLFVDLTMNIIAYFFLGVTFDKTSNFAGEPPFDAKRLYAALALLEKHVLLQTAGRSRWFKFLPTSEGREYRQAQDYLQQNLKPRVAMALQVARASEAESPSVSSSFQDSMLVQFAKNPQHDQDSLMAETRAFIFAGHDTTAHTMSFAVGELGLNPQVFQAAQQAVDQAWEKEGELNLSTLKHFDYIEAVVKETLRLHPVATGIPLVTTQETELDGVKMPKNVGVEPFFWAAGQDPEMFPKPEEFRPERWLQTETDQQPLPLLFGFSRGSHFCVGAPLALLEATVMLSLLLRHFNWELVNGRDSLEDVNQYLTVFPRDRMPIRFVSRTKSRA